MSTNLLERALAKTPMTISTSKNQSQALIIKALNSRSKLIKLKVQPHLSKALIIMATIIIK